MSDVTTQALKLCGTLLEKLEDGERVRAKQAELIEILQKRDALNMHLVGILEKIIDQLSGRISAYQRFVHVFDSTPLEKRGFWHPLSVARDILGKEAP